MNTHTDYVNRTDRWSIHIFIATTKDIDQNVDTRQDDRVYGLTIPDNYIKIGQRQDFNDYELVEDEYLKFDYHWQIRKNVSTR